VPKRRRATVHPRAPAGAAPRAIGARLREVRLAHRMSQAQVGAPYYGRQAISAVERGRTLPSLRMLLHLAGRLGTGVRELIPTDL
jgi:transcriptional regulator with XRE-family HTH domain